MQVGILDTPWLAEQVILVKLSADQLKILYPIRLSDNDK
jgi:hypothetical protein